MKIVILYIPQIKIQSKHSEVFSGQSTCLKLGIGEFPEEIAAIINDCIHFPKSGSEFSEDGDLTCLSDEDIMHFLNFVKFNKHNTKFPRVFVRNSTQSCKILRNSLQILAKSTESCNILQNSEKQIKSNRIPKIQQNHAELSRIISFRVRFLIFRTTRFRVFVTERFRIVCRGCTDGSNRLGQ